MSEFENESNPAKPGMPRFAGPRILAGIVLGVPLVYLVFALLRNIGAAPLPGFSAVVVALSSASLAGMLLSRRIGLFIASCTLAIFIIYSYWGAFVPFLK